MQHFYVNFTFPFDFFCKKKRRQRRTSPKSFSLIEVYVYEHYYPPKLEVLTATAVALSFFVKSPI